MQHSSGFNPFRGSGSLSYRRLIGPVTSASAQPLTLPKVKLNWTRTTPTMRTNLMTMIDSRFPADEIAGHRQPCPWCGRFDCLWNSWAAKLVLIAALEAVS